MIKGFENETAPLNEYERNVLLPVLLKGFSNKIGRSNIISSSVVCSRMRACGYKLTGERLRKIINHIRRNDLIMGLVGTSRGYYIATSEQELLDCEESLRGREEAVRAARYSIARQRLQMFPHI